MRGDNIDLKETTTSICALNFAMVFPTPFAKLARDLGCASPFKLNVEFGEGHVTTVSVSDLNDNVMSYVEMHYRRMGMIDGQPRGDLQSFHNNMIAMGMTVSASFPCCVYKFTLCTCCDESERMSKVLKEFALTALHLDDDFLNMEKTMRVLGFAKPEDTILIVPFPCAVSLSPPDSFSHWSEA